MMNLGPSAPFVGIATLGVVAACVVVVAVLMSCRERRLFKRINSRHKSIVVLLVAVITFVLWGTSTGHGGPHSDGGMVGYTQGGMLHYVSAISYQARAGAPWTHDCSVRPLALLGTIGLSAAAVIAAVVGTRWISGGMPNHPMHGSGEVERM